MSDPSFEPRSPVYIDDHASIGQPDCTHLAAALKLVCPGQGRVLGVLMRTGTETLGYSVPGAADSHPWPPDPAATEYRQRCDCAQCHGRTVGAPVAALIAAVIALSTTAAAPQDTVTVGYL